jgi:23S rRNA (uracil1939-C5)-methyltransferase
MAKKLAETLTIARLGHGGDGVADAGGGRVFVPFTLPGETVLADRDGDRAAIAAILAPSPQRVEPPCPHFGICGGCALQHWDPTAYRAWKREEVVATFAQRGIEAPVGELIPCAPASRRRAVLTAERQGRTVILGFNQANSHEVVPVPECSVLAPPIAERLGGISMLIAPLVPQRRRGRVTIIAADNGLDIAVDDIGRSDPRAIEVLATRVADPAIARVTIGGETIYRAREPEIGIGAASLLPPPGGFIQAVASAEAAMAEAVIAGVGDAKRVADLFAGIGTFSLRLARSARVAAFDGDSAASSALEKAARRAAGLKLVTAARRDLFASPLTPQELKPFDAVVFDPPRAGAKSQAEQLAASAVPRVVAVSCNPATLARDARILIDGGYRLTSVTPIDQFLWSAHIESVAVFER